LSRNFFDYWSVQDEKHVERDDATLIDLALGGDAAAFGSLVRRYQDRLYTALIHVAGSRDEAEDVAQDAFVQAYLKLRTFERQSKFYTWLYRIAFNAAVSRRRKRRTEGSIEQARAAVGDEPADRRERPEERLLRKERADLLSQALAGLSDEHRAILILREMEGCDYEQISQILDLPVGTVRSRLHRARAHLRVELGAWFLGPEDA
jgi:RNA polymerase sigma-70 factor, ECF subfamily